MPPPIRPPMWPPMAMPGMAKVSTRFRMRSIPMSERSTDMPRWRMPTTMAPSRPNAAPDAPTVSANGSAISAPAEPGQERGEVEQREPQRPDGALQHLAEDPDEPHVEAEVQEAGVREATGDEPVPLAVAQGDGAQAEVDLHRPLAVEEVAAVQADHEDEHVGGDDQLGRDGRLPGVPPPQPFDRRRPGRPHALDALRPDRRLHEALGARRPAAARAGPPGLAIRVPEAGGRRRGWGGAGWEESWR